MVSQPREHSESPDLTSWLRSMDILRDEWRGAVPVLQRCATCRATPGCQECPGCQSGQVCHRLPPCPQCGVVQEIAVDRLARHPIHRQLYGNAPEREVFETSSGMLFVQSVAAVGIIEPILGLEADDDDDTGARAGDVIVLSGWRRVLAARACGATTMPCRLVDGAAVPRRADVDLLIVSANLQREKTIDEIRSEAQVWKQALASVAGRRPKPWELRSAVAKIMGTSVRAIRQAEAASASQRLQAARDRLAIDHRDESAQDETAIIVETDLVSRLRQEQQPGDLRGRDIVTALDDRQDSLLSTGRDEVIHASIERAAQTAKGTSILDVKEVAPFWRISADAILPEPAALTSEVPNHATGPASLALVQDGVEIDVWRVRNLTIYRGESDALPFPTLPAVDLIIAAPSWLEPLARPFLTPAHVPFAADWRERLQGCLRQWRKAIRPGGRLLLVVPLSTPLHPGLPVLISAVEQLRLADWAIGGTLVLDDPGLHGPLYAVPHPDQVLAPKGPARLILTAAPLLPTSEETDEEERSVTSWAAPLPGHAPRQVATVEEAALNHLWKYAGPGRRSRWLPEFEPGLPYHLIRIFSRPDATVFLPELGGSNLVRGCMRTGRRIVGLATIDEQIAEVVDRVSRDGEAGSDVPFVSSSLAAVTGRSVDAEQSNGA